jgi:hypothetical protein
MPHILLSGGAQPSQSWLWFLLPILLLLGIVKGAPWLYHKVRNRYFQ